MLFLAVLIIPDGGLRGQGSSVRPPEPVGPVPSMRQLMWQNMEFCGFVHFTVNTFTDKEWGYGDEPESVFNPTDFDAGEMVRIAKNAGMKGIVLTAKHHDGFCLWPSKLTEHSVKRSPWKNGGGDVVKEFADACALQGMKFGVYLSPWDRNNTSYGTPAYIDFYRGQLTELLTNYGNIFEVWFDGANGGGGFYGGARATRTIDRRTYYDWPGTWKLVRQLQDNAVMFSDVGPDLRWVGNENGVAGETCWSSYTPVGEHGDEPAPGYVRSELGEQGQPDGKYWLPAECDVSIRPGWFYHPAEDTLVKSPETLYNLYFESVGRNASLLLNVPPDRRGRFDDADIHALMGLRKLLDETFSHDLAKGARVEASNVRSNDPRFGASNVVDDDSSNYWATDDSITSGKLTLSFGEPKTFNVIMLQEYIPLGQRIGKFSVEISNGEGWKTVAGGTTIGHKRLLRIPALTATKVRLNILQSKPCPTLSRIGLFRSPDVGPGDNPPHN